MSRSLRYEPHHLAQRSPMNGLLKDVTRVFKGSG